jgi:orotate phosphoribosyltransferase
MPSPAFDSDRHELERLLCARGIRRSTPDHPLCFPDGRQARWMLDSLRVSLTARGAELAGRCLWALLQRFHARQVATYGTTAIPLLQSCILQSGGALRGLLIRKEPKRASGQRIEGDFDPSEPVVLIDDSIHSGNELTAGIEILRQAGAWVEGAVVLVRFGWGGGFARLQARGLRMESLFDAVTDLSPKLDGPEGAIVPNGSKIFGELRWADHTFSEGLHPATLAREVIACVLAKQPIPRPPARLDRGYDAAGGVWVSVRPRSQILLRHARDGFWHLPGETPEPLPLELIRVAARTASRMQEHADADSRWAGSAVAVTLFGALERCQPAQLDNDRYGILVKSRVRPAAWGGALPRMPGMSREWAQLEHARKNARLAPHEPYDLFRHTLTKHVEPGEAWQPTGAPLPESTGHNVPWYQDHGIAGRIAERAFDLLRAQLASQEEALPPLAADLTPDLDALFVTVLWRGQVLGCTGGRVARLDDDLRKAVAHALLDRRFSGPAGSSPPWGADASDWSVMVSLLHQPLQLGIQTPDEIAVRVRLGQQALLVFQDRGAGQARRQALLLPFAALQASLSRPQYVAELIDKAGITRAPYAWVSYECQSWLGRVDGAQPLPQGLPGRPRVEAASPQQILAQCGDRLRPLLLRYLLRWQRPQGGRVGIYRPLLSQSSDELALARQVHGSFALALAQAQAPQPALADALHRDLRWLCAQATPDARGDLFLPEPNPTIAPITSLLRTLCTEHQPEHAALRDAILDMLWRRIDSSGRISTHPSGAASGEIDAQQDHLPAQALLALAHATQLRRRESSRHELLSQPQRDAIARALRYYGHRFFVLRGWGHVTWLTQALVAWWQLLEQPAWAEQAHAILDWALDFQQETSGGFVNGEQPDAPGCMTAAYLEGLVAGLRLAQAQGDAARSARYAQACAQALHFLDGLIYQERDRPLLPDFDRAEGGLRMSSTASDVRIDFVQHLLCALLELRRAPLAVGT